LFVPGLVCLLLPLLLLTFRMKGTIARAAGESRPDVVSKTHRNIIFFSGLGVLLLIPVFKSATHLPPFMGMLFGLGILWLISELLHKDKDTADKDALSVMYALRKIDTASILFFLGILLAIAALQSAGVLTQLADALSRNISNEHITVMLIGICSAVVDNVPLVAAAIGMYDPHLYPVDHSFWEFLAYCTGTGGSMLIIGSAAGVAVMGMEKISFGWYLKKIGWLALAGFFAGAVTYIAFFS
jgi:Na+/H+ antiporter NhaD/arsenite permease-like protein